MTTPATVTDRPRPRSLNLRLCSSCELGAHELCTGRLGAELWTPAFTCHCLCRHASADPLWARYLDGDR